MVVPTATTRPPRGLGRARSRAAVSSGRVKGSAGTAWSLTSSTWTGRKVPGPDVQDDLGRLDAARLQAAKHGLGEVEAGGGRGHAALLAGEDGLVPRAVVLAVGTLDVGRQGHVARSLERFVHRSAQGTEAHVATPVLEGRGVLDHDLQIGADRDHRPGAKPLARTQEGLPGAAAPGPDEQDLGRPPPGRWPRRRAGKTRLRFTTTRSPGDKRSGRSRKMWCRRSPVLRSRTSRREASRSREGLLGDGRRGQRVVEVFYAHACLGAAAPEARPWLRTASSVASPRAGPCRSARRRAGWRCGRGGCGRGTRAGAGRARRCPRSSPALR